MVNLKSERCLYLKFNIIENEKIKDTVPPTASPMLYAAVSRLWKAFLHLIAQENRYTCHALSQISNNQFLLTMKKTLITLFTLAGVVAANETFTITESITLKEASALGSHSSSFAWNNIKTKENAETQLENLLSESGFSVLTSNNSWHYFSAGSNEAETKASYSFSENGSHVIQKGTGNATVLTYTLDVSQLFSSDYPSDYTQTITGLTFTSTTSSIGDCYYTAFAISESGKVTCLTSSGINNVKADISFTVENLTLGATDKIMLMYRQGDTDETTITGLSITAAGVVPEPTTATLSLLALCGLAARRRRASR